MRWTLALAVCVFLLSLSICSAGALPEHTVSNLEVCVTVFLVDGSQLVGKPTRPDAFLEVVSDALGKVKMAFTKLAAVELGEDHANTVVRLTNGDILRGKITERVLDITTLIGRVSIPVQVVTRIQVHTASVGDSLNVVSPEDWDALPFPVTCDWPGPRGEGSKIYDNSIWLQGFPIRTRKTYSLPVVFECDFEFTRAAAGGGSLMIYVFPKGPQREGEPDNTLYFRLDGTGYGYETPHMIPTLHQCDGSKFNDRMVWCGASQPIELGKTNHLRLELEKDSLTMTLNDKTMTARGFNVDYKDVQIELWHWQPMTRWVLHNVRIP